ncbi:MAG: hypothetical protein BMS9Abin15_0998 [Gammaproteobacteria bacterium]|nr:MAG: hypothetical protein BMS9Abin15_0998 [Gammaproteobacteria bacterium]
MKDKFFTETYPAGSVIFQEGDPGDHAYIIEKGKVEISTLDHEERIVLSQMGPGNLLGEMAMIDDAPRTATVVATEDTVLTVVGRDQLKARLESAEPILRMLVNVILARYRSGLSRVKGTPLEDQLTAPLAIVVGEDHALNKIRLENELKNALEQGELEVHYQPLLSIKNHTWAGFEALTRWHHPERGNIPPDQFIGLAEETNLIVPIGLFVLETAVNKLKEFNEVRAQIRPDLKPLIMGVNVSGKQLADVTFLDQVAKVVAKSGIEPECLKLEITESLVVDYNSVADWIARAKGLGFTIALDDFGTGYSSFGHLLELDFDTLKIDRAFIRGMRDNHKALELVRGIVALSHGLGLDVVAEGIESDTQLTQLDALNVKYGQGYFISKPVDAEHIMDHLKKGV